MNLRDEAPDKIRKAIRADEYNGDTSGYAAGRVQANLVIVKKDIAFDFMLFCHANPKPCPVIEVTQAGDPEPKISAPGADLRTDLGGYRVFQDGNLVDECTDIKKYWANDLVAFLIGCSYSFEWVLRSADIRLKHIEKGCGVPVYKSSIPLQPVGRFKGNMVTSMRPLNSEDTVKAIQITSRYPQVHGAPVHIGAPENIGVDLEKPDFGTRLELEAGELPVFWACGVTPQAVALESGVDFMITHAAGRMFITDQWVKDLAVI